MPQTTPVKTLITLTKNALYILSSFKSSLKFPKVGFLGKIVIPPSIVSLASFNAFAKTLRYGKSITTITKIIIM